MFLPVNLRFRLRCVACWLVGCLVVGLVPPASAQAQRGLAGWVKRQLNDTTVGTHARVVAYPTFAFAPETSVELGVRTFSLFNVYGDTARNRLSEVNLYLFGTFKGQFGGWVENAVFSNQNLFFFLGRVRYQQFPLLYFGIGPGAPKDYTALVNSRFFQIRQRVLRQAVGHWYLGLEFDFQDMRRVTFEKNDQLLTTGLPLGAAGSTNTGLGPALVYDSRPNILNVRRGEFLEVGALFYDARLGNRYPYRGLILDARAYRPLGRTNRVLAAQVYGNFLTGQVPFNNLALLGGESLMRGYYLGRYRDKNLVAAQVEARWLPFAFSKRWGGALFAGAGGVAPTVGDFRLDGFRWAAGGGIRFAIYPKKDVYIRGDVGFTREGRGFYISLGEAF